jgi:hypothetical protein
MSEKWKYLDEYLRLRLADLEPRMFEEFFLHFLRAGISLTIKRRGQEVTKRILSAELYAAGSGRDQKGIDLRVEVEGGECWAFQCKRHQTWTPSQTRAAIQEAAKYSAQHYFLVVACDPHGRVQDEVYKHPNWTFWNLSTICAEFRLRVPVSKHAKVLFFLSRAELKRFVPFTTEALIPPEKYFERFLGADKLFRHDWKLVGREKEMQGLRDFLDGRSVVQIMSAGGGEGKSRLLWELCRTLPQQMPGVEVLCLNTHCNPHRTDNDFEFAFLGDAHVRVIIVDDAHRTEQVPLQLLSLVAQEAKSRNSKIILATRPQGIEALSHKLYETGLQDKLAPQILLNPLKKSQVKALALESLGADLADIAADLASLTNDSPFLTVIAGELLRQKRLTWGRWASHDEFRRQVFREFEHTNLESLPEPDREVAKGLLRLLALLAPVAFEPKFAEAAARCLGCSPLLFESHLARLRQSELVAGRDDGLRIVPDLFADFLVFDACYEPAQKKPAFVQQILREFSDRGSALLRNLSEATWLARAENISGDDLLKPLVDQEFRKFESAGYYERRRILEHWSHFSIYLPNESLDLAKLAVRLKSAGADSDRTQVPFKIPALIDSKDYVCRQLATLLTPVAKYHQKCRHAALDFLWEQGVTVPWVRNQEHPWEAIQEVIKFEPKKPIAITLDALDWLGNRLQSPSALKVLESRDPVLRLLLGPCFTRTVEWTWSEGRTIHLSKHIVSVENTQPIRDRAFDILDGVIQSGSWLAALDAISALEPAIRRVAAIDFPTEEDLKRFSEEWSKERLKALALYEKAATKQPHFAVRYEILQNLKRDLAYENEPSFAKEARRVIAGIPGDLSLRTTTSLLSQGAYEFSEEAGMPRTAEGRQQIQTLRNERVRKTAAELAAGFQAPPPLHGFLKKLTVELEEAGYHPAPVMLFMGLAEAAPDLALGLAREIIWAEVDTPLSQEWPLLLEKNPAVGDAKQIELFQMAARMSLAGVSSAVSRFLAWKARQDHSLSEAERILLIEISGKATEEQAMNLLDLVAWCSDANAALAIQILETLPIRKLASKIPEQVLRALVPYRERNPPLPQAAVRSVVMQLIDVPDLDQLDMFSHSREWEEMIKQYPRLVFDLMLARIDRASEKDAPVNYQPIPLSFDRRLNLPELAKEPDYADICRNLWEGALKSEGPQQLSWMRLLQAVAMDNSSIWLDRMQQEIESATSEELLYLLVRLLKFDGSLIIFRFPELTKAFLKKAKELGGQRLYDTISAGLYTACGPQVRSYTDGKLDTESDYVEAEAAKAAETHAADEWLGPFYRWIVEIEQKNRLMNKMRSEAEMATLD